MTRAVRVGVVGANGRLFFLPQDMAEAGLALGRVGEARELLTRALPRLEGVFGKEFMDTLRARELLAEAG